jgi:adhesin transport system outer membrane protein
LNAQNQYFNAQISLTSWRSVVVFADYQLLAAMGTLREYLKRAQHTLDLMHAEIGQTGRC